MFEAEGHDNGILHWIVGHWHIEGENAGIIDCYDQFLIGANLFFLIMNGEVQSGLRRGSWTIQGEGIILDL